MRTKVSRGSWSQTGVLGLLLIGGCALTAEDAQRDSLGVGEEGPGRYDAGNTDRQDGGGTNRGDASQEEPDATTPDPCLTKGACAPDAGSEVDSGQPDAGAPGDAGPGPDAETPSDAGGQTDAGGQSDAGSHEDAGGPADAGSQGDAGGDAGTPPDGGPRYEHCQNPFCVAG